MNYLTVHELLLRSNDELCQRFEERLRQHERSMVVAERIHAQMAALRELRTDILRQRSSVMETHLRAKQTSLLLPLRS